MQYEPGDQLVVEAATLEDVLEALDVLGQPPAVQHAAVAEAIQAGGLDSALIDVLKRAGWVA